jgi:DNA repair photolyase
MNYKTIYCSFLLNKITRKDKLFNGEYTLDPYQNCEFNCKYCDSTQNNTIYIKDKIPQILKNELKKTKKGRIIIGSTVDPYQETEKKYQNTRKILELIKQNNFPCHLLTKSKLVLRDIDLLSNMNNSIVSLSLFSLDKKISDIFETNLPSPSERLEVIKKLSENDVQAGLAVMPILPFVTEKELEDIVKKAKEHKAKYILHEYLELKGDQKHIFINTLERYKSELVKKYEQLYQGSYRPKKRYISEVNKIIDDLRTKYDLKNKI